MQIVYLIYNYRVSGDQQNTLVHQCILDFQQRSDSDPLDAMLDGRLNEQQRLNIPAFLVALTKTFAMHDLKTFLEEGNQMKQTPLHYAVKNGLYETTYFLVHDCKVNVNLKNQMNNAPLHVAVLNNRVEIVQLLVGAKADVLAQNKEGYSCLKHAEKREYASLCDYLDPILVSAQIWQKKNCLVKILLHKQSTKFKKLSAGVFREIIKYA